MKNAMVSGRKSAEKRKPEPDSWFGFFGKKG